MQLNLNPLSTYYVHARSAYWYKANRDPTGNGTRIEPIMNEYQVWTESAVPRTTVVAASVFEAIVEGAKKLNCDTRRIRVELLTQLTDIPF